MLLIDRLKAQSAQTEEHLSDEQAGFRTDKSTVQQILALKPDFHSNAMHATQSLALRALRKRKPQETQALDWLLR